MTILPLLNMAIKNGRHYTNKRGLNLLASNGVLRFETPTTTPTTTSGERVLYVNSSNELIFDDGSSTTVMGGLGGSSVPTWETLFGADYTFTITPDATWTIAGNRATATDVLTITNIAGGSGSCIQITNSGSGNDIDGTSNTWSVSKAGVATFVGVTPGGDITSTATAIDWDLADNNSSALSFDSTGAAGLLEFDTTNSSEVLKTSAGTFQVTAGLAELIQTSNTVSGLRVTNNTITTFGADANSAGVAVFRSTSLTTGSLVQLQLTEGTLNGGFYLTCRDVTGGANVMTIGEDGNITISGAGGSNMLTITAGDILISDGSITLTDADDAASLTITNASAVTVTGAVQYILDGLTTGTGVLHSTDGLTTGKAVHITGTSPNALTSGELLSVEHASGNITGTLNKSGNLSSVVSTRTVTTGTVSDDFDMLSLTRTSIINGAGAFTATGAVVRIENAITNTSGTVTDTTIGLEIVMDSLGTGDGVKITHAATGGIALDIIGAATTVSDVLITTTGVKADDKGALEVTNSGATAAGGSILRVTNTGTPAAATSYLVDFDYTGATMTNNPVGVIIQGGGTTAQALEVTHTGAGANNTGALSVTSSGAIAAGGSVLRVTATGTPAAATSYLVDLDYTGATFTNNPDAIYIATAGTGRAVHITSSGLAAQGSPNVDIESTNAGAVGSVLRLSHQGGSQAASDAIGTIVFLGEDDAAADNVYGTIECVVVASTAGTESGRLDFSAGDATGGVSLALRLTHDGTNGIATIGDGAATGILQSNGNYDLQLQTGNATTGNITITDGANGNITLTPNGSGAIDLAGKILTSETTTSSGAGAVAVTGAIHEITTTAADALTLADGTEGQVLKVVMVVDGGNGTLTPTNLAGGTTITFDAVGDAVTLLFTAAEWYVIGNNGAVIA